ncbi:AraC family transcriptional regulator N-terminal domain-containing protein [Herpetosiphon llansteffanensis]
MMLLEIDRSLEPEALLEPERRALAQLLAQYAPHDGRFGFCMPQIYAIRESHPHQRSLPAIYQPSVCIVAQGAKQLVLGDQTYNYDAIHVLVVAVDLPVAAQITQASLAQPYLCFKLEFDVQRVAELALKVYPQGLPAPTELRAIATERSNRQLVQAAIRLLELMQYPAEAELLAPLVIDEMIIRLLHSPFGNRLAQIGQTSSRVTPVAQAISWLRQHYAQPIQVEQLADLAHLSVSAFHLHFKAVTALSPIQFQKTLRLHEARRLLVATTLEIGQIGQQVGYASSSQFSREYRRYFGCSPTDDLARLRQSQV